MNNLEGLLRKQAVELLGNQGMLSDVLGSSKRERKNCEPREFVVNNWLEIKVKLLGRKYPPSLVRRVEIPKTDGGLDY